ncbi:MAG: transposase, partial [Burkholderiales bacterium]|nr:transposase [Opitutaceae bacterium]
MKNPSPYLKMRVLGAIDMAEGASLRARTKAAAALTFTDEDGHPCQFTWRTIESWLLRYKKHGSTALANTARSDKTKTRKVTPEQLLEAIRAVLPKAHGKTPTRATLYRLCIEQGVLNRSQIAPNTFTRIVKRFELLKAERDSEGRHRQAFAKAHANELWQADTLFGPHVAHGAPGAKVQTRLIAFVDDASRVCCHGEFFCYENVDTLVAALRSALYKRGVPESLYVDNGSIYSSKELIQVCARVGCLLLHTPVRDGASKGKVERFFRTVRDQFLSRTLDLSSLEALNRQFIAWVEEHYNAQLHSVLGMSPLDRFALDRKRVRYFPPNESNEELFFVEEDRTVRTDNTFSFSGLRFEAPRHLPNSVIQVRFERKRAAQRVIVYYKGERMGSARLLDLVGNDRKPAGGQRVPTTSIRQAAVPPG